MTPLEPADFRKLVGLIQQLPYFESERDRRELVKLAGLEKLLPSMNLAGNQTVAASSLISQLRNYGYFTPDQTALGMLLNMVETLVGREDQPMLAGIIRKYQLTTPLAVTPGIVDWSTNDSGESVLEKIIGENTLRPIAFLAQGLQIARAVALVWARGGTGTGFLITPDLLLTNHHVVPNANLLADMLFRFNYEENWQGEVQKPAEYRPKAGGLYYAAEELDYAIVELAGDPGQEWKWLPLRTQKVNKEDRVNIVQHAGGLPKQISIQNNYVAYVDRKVIQYVTSTLPGSSGSPVLNDRWDVVALHHAGGTLVEPDTQRRYYRNEGIRVDAILADLPAEIRQRVTTAL